MKSDKLKMSRNKRNSQETNREKFGIRVPHNTRMALLFDKENENRLWAEAITKEMAALERLYCFEYMSPAAQFQKKDGWQYAPMCMIYDIKQEDLRHKARFVVGGHFCYRLIKSYNIFLNYIRCFCEATDASSFQTRITINGRGYWKCVPNCTMCRPEFNDKQGCKVVMKRALYGLKTASRSFHEFFADKLRQIGFTCSRVDQDLWWKRTTDYHGYDFIATHVDDLIIAAKNPAIYMNDIEQQFAIRNKAESPTY
jgi:hypothetical protein